MTTLAPTSLTCHILCLFVLCSLGCSHTSSRPPESLHMCAVLLEWLTFPQTSDSKWTPILPSELSSKVTPSSRTESWSMVEKKIRTGDTNWLEWGKVCLGMAGGIFLACLHIIRGLSCTNVCNGWTHGTESLRLVHLFICKFYLKGKKYRTLSLHYWYA